MRTRVLVVGTLACLLIGILGYKILTTEEIPTPKADWYACSSDADCAEVSSTCCSCRMGGVTACVNKDFVEEYERSKNCPPDVRCLAVLGCLDSCACVNNSCTVIPS